MSVLKIQAVKISALSRLSLGTCYAYQFDTNGYMRNAPENIMVNAYFDKMDLDDNSRLLFGIQGY